MTKNKADSYGVALPASWWRVPTRAAEYSAFASDVLAHLSARGVPPAPRRAAEELLRDVNRQLDQSNVRYAALGMTEVEEDGQAAGLVVAAVTVQTMSRAEMGTASKLTAGVLARGLSRTKPGEDSGSPVDLDAPETLELPAGEAVRLRRQSSSGAGAAYVESFLVPHDDGERLCVLQCSTPNTELAASFSSLFRRIADTLRIFHPGEPTDWHGEDGGDGNETDG